MQTLCSRCQSSMRCGALERNAKTRAEPTHQTPCWCVALPVLPSTAYAVHATCLCGSCLQAQLDAGVVLYGIPNCDTVKKARAWFSEQRIDYAFWDYKKHGVPSDQLSAWLNMHGWQVICNTRGPTWRNIPDALRASVTSAASALPALTEHASAIKRPIVSWGNTYGNAVSVGFDVAAWQGIIKI